MIASNFPKPTIPAILRQGFGVPWWTGFALSWLLPLTTLAFAVTGPHDWPAALAWTLPVFALILADLLGPDECRRVPSSAPRWFFDGLLYGLAGLQIANLLAIGGMVARLDWADGPAILTALINLLALRILGGTNVCCSVIAPAHELIHRHSRWQRLLGRLLLLTCFYDHFHVAHRLGHHARLGTADDPSSAHASENYPAFFWRSLRGQWRIAWRHRPGAVLQGLAIEFGMMVGYALAFGWLALFMWAYINVVGIRLLEAVNYFQHFGLRRKATDPRDIAWRCDSAVSLFLFLGLPRHADHHRRPGVSYPDLDITSDQPRLPCGYLGMAVWVKNASGSFRRWAARAGGWESGLARPCAGGRGADDRALQDYLFGPRQL
jgi:alkane 1-monooxygenase